MLEKDHTEKNISDVRILFSKGKMYLVSPFTTKLFARMPARYLTTSARDRKSELGLEQEYRR